MSGAMNHSVQPARRVDEALRITYAGQYWNVQALPGVRVGDLVRVQPTRRGVFLHVRAATGSEPGILVSQLAPVHSHWHTSGAVDTQASLGSLTTNDEPVRPAARPCQPASSTAQRPPNARREAHKHNHTPGTASVVTAAHSISIELVLHVRLSAKHRSPNNRK